MNATFDFTGSRVVITGACGIHGGWIAAAFARAGATLCLTDRDADALERRLRDMPAAAGSFTATADLTDAASIAAFAARVGAAWGAPDILVNNAGVYPSGFLLDIDAAEWDRIMGVNLRAPFLMTQHIAKLMIARDKPGAVVNISSGASRSMRRTSVPYCTSKAAVDRLTKGYALELAPFGIRVNAVEPGFAAGSTSSPLTQAHIDAVTGANPMGRPSGPDDAASAVMFLCSPAASYINGATLSVDGGGSAGSMAVFQDKKAPL